MLFFKEIIDQKLKDPSFRQFYEKECHLCSTTMKVIANLEEKKQLIPDILDKLNISRQEFERLKQGENCNPEMVRQLCVYLGLMEPGLFENCWKFKQSK